MVHLDSALRKPKSHYIIIVGFSLIVHGLLLLNDGVYYDGWPIYHHLVDKNWNLFHLWLTESGGIPSVAYLHWVMGYLPSMIFSYKLLAFLSITFSGMLVYLICNELRLFSRTWSLFIALLSLSYPAFQLSVDLIAMPYLICYCLFLLACFMALRSEKRMGFPHYLLRIGSLALFVLSFSINSLLVFYYGFLLVLILHARRDQNMSLNHVFTRFLPHRLDYVLLPIMYFVVARVFFPAHGFYADIYPYNPISFLPSRIFAVYGAFINNAIYAHIKLALLFLLALIFVQWIRSTVLRGSTRSVDEKGTSYALLFFGIALLALAIFPYAAVGKAASVHGYATRHALLVALPMALIVVAVTRLLFADKEGFTSKLGFFFLTVLLLSFTYSSVANYTSWQARWVKDRSIMVNLAKLENAEGVSVFWVDDQYQLGGQASYYFYEWPCIFKSVWGDKSRIGLDQSRYTSDFLDEWDDGWGRYSERVYLSDFDPAGCQAILTIRPGPESPRNTSLPNARLSALYFYYRFFHNDHLTEFLHGVTEVQVQPISAPQAVNCPTK